MPFSKLLDFLRGPGKATEPELMKLVVGLGNPGSKYKGTRHNVGFEVIDSLVERFAIGQRAKSKFNANIHEVMIGQTKTLLISPLTFMNLSGQSVKAAIDFFKLDLENLLVVCDDLNLDVGRIRVRAKGSAGGQNGIKDIIRRVGTQEFSRLRIGIGRPPANWDTSDYVLGKFDDEDTALIRNAIDSAALACEQWVRDGVQTTMNRFNADPEQRRNKNKRQNEASSSDTDQTANKPSD